MKKRIFTIFLVILIAVTNMTVCYADTTSTKVDSLFEDIGIDNWDEDLGSDAPGALETVWDNIGDDLSKGFSGILKLVVNIITIIPKAIVKLLTGVLLLVFPSMDDIIFNQGITWGVLFRLSPYFEGSALGFAGSMRDLVSTIYQIFRYIALIGFVIAIAAIAVKMIMASIGKQKQQYKEALKNWLIGLVLLVVGHWIMIYAIYISDWLVEMIIDIKNAVFDHGLLTGITGGPDLQSMFTTAVGDAAGFPIPLFWLIWAVMAIVAVIVFISMNMKIVKVYLERVIVVGVLIMIFPLVTVFYAFEKSGIKRGSTFETWLKTFMNQVFIQPVHALSLLGVMVALSVMDTLLITQIPILGMIIVLMVLNTMFTIENVIKGVFAVNGAAMGAPANVGHMVRDAANDGFNVGRSIKNARVYGADGKLDRTATKALRRATAKDEAIKMARKWGRKNGINIGDLGLIESRNVAGKMKATVKSGNINPAHIPEITSKLVANGDPHEKLMKFGIKNISEFENLARANDFRAMLVIQEEVEPGSTDKYLNRDKNGNVMYGSVRSDAQDLYNKSKVSSAQRKNDIKKMGQGTVSDAGKDALQVALQLDDQENYDRFCSMLGKTDAEKNNFDFTDDELQAMAYCVNEGIDLSEVMRNGKVDMTLVNPPKASARRSDSRTFVTSGFRKDSSGKPISSEVFKMQKVAQSYDKEDKANVDNILAHTNITRSQWDDFKDTGNMNGFTEEDLRTAIYYLDDITNVPAGFDQNVMSERELKHAYYDVPETDIISSLKGVVNAGTAFDSIGFDNTTADAFEVYTDRYDSSFGAALATTNAAYKKSYTKDDVRRIVRDGKNAKEADVKFVRGLIKHMIKKA